MTFPDFCRRMACPAGSKVNRRKFKILSLLKISIFYTPSLLCKDLVFTTDLEADWKKRVDPDQLTSLTQTFLDLCRFHGLYKGAAE